MVTSFSKVKMQEQGIFRGLLN